MKKKNMKTLAKTLTSLALAIAVGVLPAFASDAPAEAPSDSATVNEVKKFTPVVDGVIDPEYYESFNIDHDLPKNQTEIEKYINYDINKNPINVESYGFDIEASSYYLWDDEYLYIAVEVTDDDYGCVDDAHYEIEKNYERSTYTSPSSQDAVAVRLVFEDVDITIFASRDGKRLFDCYNISKEGNALCDVVPFYFYHQKTDESYYAVCEKTEGYVLEVCIKIKDEYRTKFLKDGTSLSCGIEIGDSPADSPYVPLSEILYVEWEEPGDSWVLSKNIYVTDLGWNEPGELKVRPLTLYDPEVYDANGDGAADSKDLTRLMKHIAGEDVEIASADINGDGVTDTKDLTHLMKHLAK